MIKLSLSSDESFSPAAAHVSNLQPMAGKIKSAFRFQFSVFRSPLSVLHSPLSSLKRRLHILTFREQFYRRIAMIVSLFVVSNQEATVVVHANSLRAALKEAGR